jgi:sortase A
VKRQLAIVAATLLSIAGLSHLAVAAYIPSKAILAQFLLRQAWAKSQFIDADVRPWPWADTHPVARLRLDRLGVDMIVLAGVNDRTMAFGPAYLETSATPVMAGHSILTGHRDTHFAFLAQVAVGDRLVIKGRDKIERIYRVVRTHVADARTDHIKLAESRDRVTLITCFPFNALKSGGPLRWVVTADAEPLMEKSHLGPD